MTYYQDAHYRRGRRAVSRDLATPRGRAAAVASVLLSLGVFAALVALPLLLGFAAQEAPSVEDWRGNSASLPAG